MFSFGQVRGSGNRIKKNIMNSKNNNWVLSFLPSYRILIHQALILFSRLFTCLDVLRTGNIYYKGLCILYSLMNDISNKGWKSYDLYYFTIQHYLSWHKQIIVIKLFLVFLLSSEHLALFQFVFSCKAYLLCYFRRKTFEQIYKKR